MENLQLVSLDRAADCVVQGVDGSIFIAHSGNLYVRYPEEHDFIFLSHIDDDDGGMLLAFDNIGNLYYSGLGTGRLWISHDYGKTFSLCLQDIGGGTFRNLIQDNNGIIYVASYASDGPAILYQSENNGRRWISLAIFRCRHVHSIAINPLNNWLYVVCGEAKLPHIAEGNYIFRSKDNGKTFYPIITPSILPNGKRRPLYLSINFIEQLVVLGTDHFEGDNGIDIFFDDGKDALYHPERVFTCPDISFAQGKGRGYFRYIVSVDSNLYTICVGENVSIGYKSSDGKKWESIFEVNDCVGFMIENNPYKNAIYFSGKKTAYALQLHGNMPVTDNTCEDWQAFLLSFDSRYRDVCKGYYLRSLQYTERVKLTLKLLHYYSIPHNGLIADVGCGVGAMILIAKKIGYSYLCGIEANPRWIIAARRLVEAYFPDEKSSPVFKLVPRGSFSLPRAFGQPYHAIFILGVFVGNGNHVPIEDAIAISYKNLHRNGMLCFNVHPGTYGECSPDFCLELLKRHGFRNILCQKINSEFMVSACK